MTASVRLGTRGSTLAMTQSGTVARMLTAATGTPVELVPVTTHGDTATGSLVSLGGTGVFAAALREALLAGECDIVVHSLKDLPNAPYPGITLIAVPGRESARDALCTREAVGLDALAPGARVGTGSPRRAAQVLSRRPDLVVADIRGNVDTRLRKVAEGEYDAIVLAEAGLRRISRDAEIREAFDLDQWPTSAGQGALAVEMRTADVGTDLGAQLRSLNDPRAELTALVERAVLAELEAGCAAPVGISAREDGDTLALIAQVYRSDGGRSIRVEQTVPVALVSEPAGRKGIAARVVAELRARGVDDLDAENRAITDPESAGDAHTPTEGGMPS